MKYVIAYDHDGNALVAVFSDAVCHRDVAMAMKRGVNFRDPRAEFHLFSAGFFDMRHGMPEPYGESESLRTSPAEDDVQTLSDFLRNVTPRKKSKKEIEDG